MAQKVITVNINVYEQTVTNRHSAYEVTFVNRFLDEGWTIKQVIHSPTAAANWTNITFILEKWTRLWDFMDFQDLKKQAQYSGIIPNFILSIDHNWVIRQL